MKNLLARLLQRLAPLRAAANDVLIANALGESEAKWEVQQDGTFFVPYGRYSHAKGLQIFDKAAAEEMHRAANGALARAAGIPIYAGHPDVPGRPDSNPAAPALGWIDDIEIGEDGARFRHRLNKRGTEAIENAEFRFYSPYWLLRKVAGGLQPVRLLSMGLTNQPRIPVPAIANDQEHTTTTDMTKEQLEAIGLAEGATPEQITARLAELSKAANDLTAEKARADKAEADLATATSDLTAANDRATKARELLVDSALDRAVLSGRLTEADKATRRAELLAVENDLDAQLSALETAEVKLPGAQTGDLTKARAAAAAENDATARSVERQKLVTAELAAIENDKTGGRLTPAARYDLAYRRAEQKRPDLFTAQANA